MQKVSNHLQGKHFQKVKALNDTRMSHHATHLVYSYKTRLKLTLIPCDVARQVPPF